MSERQHAPAEPAGAPGQRRPDGQPAWPDLRRATTLPAFYQGWLDIQCRLVRGVLAGAVVVIDGDAGAPRPAPVALWGQASANPTRLITACRQAASTRRAVIERDPSSAEGPGSRYVVAYVLDTSPATAVAVDVAARSRSEVLAVLKHLEWGSAWLDLLAHRRQTARQAAIAERLQGVFGLVAQALAHERFVAAATALATALATKLGCDRASIGFVRRGRADVRAISHTGGLGHRTSLLRSIAAAMDEAIDQKAPVVYPAVPGMPARVVHAHQVASRESNAAILTVPLAHGTRLRGAMTLERPLGQPFDGQTVEFAQAVATLTGPMLEVLRRDDRRLVTKALDSAREHLAHLIGPRRLGAKLGAVAAVAVLAVLLLATDEYRVPARAVIEAEVRRVAVAPFNGYLREAPARPGDLVRRGDVLAALDDRELRLERAKWSGRYEQLMTGQHQGLAARNAAQTAIARAQIEQARAQLTLIDEQIARSRVGAAFDGVVVAGDLSQQLGAPVEKGQVLFQVAPLGAYRVVLEVDERDIADVAVGQRGGLLLAAAPGDALPFTVQQITPVSTAREGRNYFRVEAKLDRSPESLRPGMEGVGKVVVDTRRLVAIWTRSLVDWMRLMVWTWTP